MSRAAGWEQRAADGRARTGVLTLTHGQVRTPGFMPVGTRAAVRAVGIEDLTRAGAEMLLANTYHLMLRPGAEVVAALGGLHGFMAWPGPILTDSGGYQVLSLDPVITEEGAVFRSTYDGSTVRLTPEEAVAAQEALGADIAMALDVCVGLPAPPEVVRLGMERTLRWAERSLQAHSRPDQALFGIVQGGVDPLLRQESARRTADLGFSGFGIGGLAVGEAADERQVALAAALEPLPPARPRYVMGLGDAEGVLGAVAQGADLFDCVWPTRLARHGRVLTPDGDYNLRRSELATDARPLQIECPCLTCATHHRAYLRHLLVTSEMSVHRLLTIHNLTYTFQLLEATRRAIESGTFDRHHAGVVARRRAGGW